MKNTLVAVMALVTAASAAFGQYKVVHSFGGSADGSSPNAAVIIRVGGVVYGTTFEGGVGYGTVYKVGSAGHETVLYSFTGGADGGYPAGGVVLDAAGNLYGTTSIGGTSNGGVVYKLVPTSGTLTVLYSFGSPQDGDDGFNPNAGVTLDSAGNLYGTTVAGGVFSCGVVFKINVAGDYGLLYTFTGGADGCGPMSGVVLDARGNLYGNAELGGVDNFGTMYKISASGHFRVLHSFTGGAGGGSYPKVDPIRLASGDFYGATSSGLVFKQSHRVFTPIYDFSGGSVVGVVRDTAGNLYGTTIRGGTSNQGTVFKVDASGNETVLYNFTGGDDGGYPEAGVTLSKGSLYGTTYYGGENSKGVLFKLKP